MPYLPYNPRPKQAPPVVLPSADMVFLVPSAGQSLTDPTPTLRGTAVGGTTVTVTIWQGTTVVQTLTATPSSGTWAATAATLANNNYTVAATQTVSGTVYTAGPVAFTMAVGGPAPVPPAVAITAPPAGATVQDDTPPIVGTASGATTVTVQVKQGLTVVQTLTATPSGGTWQVTATTLPDGVYTLEASQTVSGVTGTANPVTFTVDMPQPSVVVSLVDGKPSGSATTDTTPGISGSAQVRPGDATDVTVQVRQGATVVQTGFPGVWGTTPTALALGSYQVRATQASTFGTGTSADFPFQVTATQAVPTPAITGPTEGQTLGGNPIVFTGTAGNAAGDSTLITVRVYPAGSSTATWSQSVTKVASATTWSMSFTANVPNGSWQARVEQAGSAGVGVSGVRQFSMSVPTPPPGVGLALSRGPTGSHWGPDSAAVTGRWTRPDNPNGTYGFNAFAVAADFYDASSGINHHFPYMNGTTDIETAFDRLQELGVRHVRAGLSSPANDSRTDYHQKIAAAAQEATSRNAARTGSQQPISFLWGFGAGPYASSDVNNSLKWWYTITTANGNYLRPLDGPGGNNTDANKLKPNGPAGGGGGGAGTYVHIGWQTVAAFQGANEPANFYAGYKGPGGFRETYSDVQDAVRARTGQTVAAGAPYVDFNTGRIVAGLAKAPQVPVFGFGGLQFSYPMRTNYDYFGDYTNRADIDCGAPHIYHGGHEPWFGGGTPRNGVWGAWGQAFHNDAPQFVQLTSYNGGATGGAGPAGPGMWTRTLPLVVTETGYYTEPGVRANDQGCVPDVVAEYLVRTMVQNYIGGFKRTYWFMLSDEAAGQPEMGLCSSTWVRKGPFYAWKNLLAVVGFRQPATNPVPISVPVSGFTPGATNKITGDAQYDTASPDRLDKLILQTSDTEYLVFLSRNRTIWQRKSNARVTVADPQTVTLTLPSGTWTTGVAEPAKNAVDNPDDGQSYANPTDGQAFAAPGVSGNGFTQSGNTLSVRLAGLTRVVKLTKTAGDALHARVVSELNQFATWCTSNSVAGAVTEFGVPTNHHAAGVTASDGDEWAGLLETYYKRLQATNLGSLQWVASEVSVGELSTYLSPAYGCALNEALPAAGPLEAHAADAQRRGIALTGLEFGTSGSFSNTNPGTIHSNYYAASQGSWTYLRSRGIKTARVGFRWERLQPTLGGALNGSYLQAIRDQVARANVAGVDVVLDCHNFGGYITSSGERKLGSATLTSAHFQDLWRRLALEFGPNARVVGFEIMNEPVAMPGGASSWRAISQACVNMIRSVDSSTPIWVGGYNWSKVQEWVATNGPSPWITGTSGIVYVAHHYFDTGADSVYAQTYASAVAGAASVPTPANPTIHVIGDMHFGRAATPGRGSQIVADSATPVAARVQIGDFTENSDQPSEDAAANGWANGFPGNFYGVLGNHDIGDDGPIGPKRTPAATIAAFTSWTNRTANWFVDLPFCRMIGAEPGAVLEGPGGRAMWLSQTTIDYIGARCGETGLPCVIFIHCPLENTVLGNTAVEFTSNPAENSGFALAPAAAVNTMLNAHSNAKVVVSGHTHSSLNGTVPGIVMTKDVGSRGVICVDVSAPAYTSRAGTLGPVKTFYLTVTATGLEVRVRDHTARAWSDFGGAQITSVPFQ